MKTVPAVALGLLAALGAGPAVRGQQPTEAPAAAHRWPCPDWTRNCFPRCGCPDDYCPHPYPRQCWPPYAPFYQCVPAGDCGCGGHGHGSLTWWFIPTPQALHDALWMKP